MRMIAAGIQISAPPMPALWLRQLDYLRSAGSVRRPWCSQLNRRYGPPAASIEDMDTNTLLIILVVILLLGGGGFFYRGRVRR